jgi:hypothetical protein
MKDLILNLNEESVVDLKLSFKGSVDLKNKKTKVLLYITDEDFEGVGYFFVGKLTEDGVTVTVPAMPGAFLSSKAYKGSLDVVVETTVFHPFEFSVVFMDQFNDLDVIDANEVIEPMSKEEVVIQKPKEEVKDYLTEDIINSVIYDARENPEKESACSPDLINEIFEMACVGMPKREYLQRPVFQPLVEENIESKPTLPAKAIKMKNKLKDIFKTALK